MRNFFKLHTCAVKLRVKFRNYSDATISYLFVPSYFSKIKFKFVSLMKQQKTKTKTTVYM